MQEAWVQSLGLEELLEKEMGTHSSILAWEILRTEEPCRLQSMGLQNSWTRLSKLTKTTISFIRKVGSANSIRECRLILDLGTGA